MAEQIDLTITRGKTFEFGFLYADDEPRQFIIEGMPSKAPLRLTVQAHGLPEGWPFWVTCVKRPAELNTAVQSSDAREVIEAEPYFVTVVDENTIEVPGVVAFCWKDLVGQGLLITRPPVDLTGWHCRAQVRDKAGGQVLFSWHSDPAETRDGTAIVDVGLSAFFLTMDAATSAGLSWRRGVYDVEAIAPTGQIYSLTAISQMVVENEVTA
ncbi:hypothetical protein SAMN05216206_2758 [Pseudomonas guineae]|uniref:Uncharacterized protein n=1 Tax=Pseudomonas guineae TaxID=425504 RepID=A0A1I3K9M7_9PSED|nr:hypothetical protein [Pseudomonas guineae]SFI69167.1 hypothetical protein SAMN05216206_2758 [Pseudomonas guineae]